MFSIWNEIISILISFNNLLMMFLGVILGVLLGAIPGLTGIMAIALLLPITFYLEPVPSLLFLLAISKGATFGGSIPAILINTPGTPANSVTAFDGYPLARQGKSIKAMKIALYSSIFADTFSDIMLLVTVGFIASLALKFGPAEFAMLIIFSLTIVVIVSDTSILKGLISAFFGLLIASIGYDPITGIPRFTFGLIGLFEGVPFLPMMVGLFALSEILIEYEKKRSKEFARFLPISDNPEDNRVTKNDVIICSKHVIKAGIIGTLLGIIPGIGPTVSSFVNYAEAKRTAAKPELFGKGSIEGLAASEAGNNAVLGANLIPLLSLGLPGDATAAVLLGAFMVQGLAPGPLLFTKHAPIIYAFILGLIFCNFVNLFIGNLAIKASKIICTINKEYIYLAVLMFCCIGSYSFKNSMFDVKIMFVFGIIGYLMRKFNFSIAALIIAFVLHPIGEQAIRQTLIISGGSWLPLITRPIAILFLALALFSLYFGIKMQTNKKLPSSD